MEFISTLSRNEMKNVKGGCSIETNYTGCGSARAVISCWGSLCRDSNIVPIYRTADCIAEVETAKLYIGSACDILWAT